ncbi:MAG TPA: hypothetical protein VKQ36_01860 [Ktedonobacterales bacterium]|nr:hypothetical protein [Ktedonobacterales bacterium]
METNTRHASEFIWHAVDALCCTAALWAATASEDVAGAAEALRRGLSRQPKRAIAQNTTRRAP